MPPTPLKPLPSAPKDDPPTTATPLPDAPAMSAMRRRCGARAAASSSPPGCCRMAAKPRARSSAPWPAGTVGMEGAPCLDRCATTINSTNHPAIAARRTSQQTSQAPITRSGPTTQHNPPTPPPTPHTAEGGGTRLRRRAVGVAQDVRQDALQALPRLTQAVVAARHLGTPVQLQERGRRHSAR